MSLHQFWVGQKRKDLAERALVAQREQVANYSKQCELAAKYHRNLNLLSTQYKNIEENPSGRINKANWESRREEEIRAKRREKLIQRQEKLRVLLAKEHCQLMGELKERNAKIMEKDNYSISHLKEKIELLKTQRKRAEEEMRKSAGYQQRQSKLPYLVEYEASLKHKEVLEALEEQQKGLQKLVMERKSKEEQKKEQLEMELKVARKKAEEAEAERVATSKKLTETLQRKVIEMESKRVHQQEFECDVQMFDKYNEIINSTIQNRKESLKIYQERIEKIALFRPSKEKVRKMSLEVANRLKVDLTNLEFLSNMISNAPRDSVKICLDCLDETKGSIQEKLAKEASRNADLYGLYEEEAAKLWKEWKTDWDGMLKDHEDKMNLALESMLTDVKKKHAECVSRKKNFNESQHHLAKQIAEDQLKVNAVMKELCEKEELLKSDVKELEEKLKKFENCMAYALSQT